MNMGHVTFTKNTASQAALYNHLKICNKNFTPHLETTVNILEYSNKIHEKAETFEAWVNQSLVGLVAAYLNDIRSYSGHITNVSVIKDFMGMGIATKLLTMCLCQAKKKNMCTITLEVYSGNVNAIALYHKFDFRPVQTKEELLLMQLDFRRDCKNE